MALSLVKNPNQEGSPPSSAQIIRAMEVASTAEAAEALEKTARERLQKVATEPAIQTTIEILDTNAHNKNYQEQINESRCWQGLPPLTEGQINLQGRVAELAKSTDEHGISVDMYFDVLPTSEYRRGYLSDKKELLPDNPEDAKKITVVDDLFKSWLDENEMISTDEQGTDDKGNPVTRVGVICEKGEEGKPKVDNNGQLVKVDKNTLLNKITSPEDGFSQFAKGKNSKLSVVMHPPQAPAQVQAPAQNEEAGMGGGKA